jgi:polyferredoxin
VLIVMTALTWKGGELLLRGYDPYFLIFSGFGHGSLGLISAVSLAVIVAGALVIPMFWCRMLCPLSAVMDALSRFGLLRVHRVADQCTSCGLCDRVCLQRLDVSDRPAVAAADCTRCLDCVAACPTDALVVRVGAPDPRERRRSFGRVPGWSLPVPVAASLLIGVGLHEPLTMPTASASFYPVESLNSPAVATCRVTGVKCRGTSEFFIRRISGFAGVAAVETFAGTNKAVITFDRARISPEALRDSISAPIRHPRTGERVPGVFTCREMKVKG